MTDTGPAILPALLWCPFPDRDSAMQTANSLLDEDLIACANIVPGMISTFVWNGIREQTEEVGALFKTNVDLLAQATARIETLHPYDDPAILGWHCDASAPGTAAWLGGIGS